jgi:hypothetical protein
MVISTLCISLSGQQGTDSAGVYITRKDFEENKLTYATPYLLKEKFGFLNSDFDYEAQGDLLLRQSNKVVLKFSPGEIYGFYNKGKKFIFVPSIERYLFVLNETPVTILVRENISYYRFNTRTDLELFYLSGQSVLKQMNEQNVDNDLDMERETRSACKDIQRRFEKMKRNGKLNIQRFSEYISEKFKTGS